MAQGELRRTASQSSLLEVNSELLMVGRLGRGSLSSMSSGREVNQ